MPSRIAPTINPWARVLWEDWQKPVGERPMYTLMRSGRGCGKDWESGQLVVTMMAIMPLKIMCVRYTQQSIDASIKSLMEDVIAHLGLSDEFHITQREIRHKVTGSVMHFRGTYDNVESIKGWQGYDVAIVNEAQEITEAAWQILDPTFRKEGCRIYLIMNPRYPTDPIAKEFLGPTFEMQRPDTRYISLQLEDNRFISADMLHKREQFRRTHSELEFEHIWGGSYDMGALHCPFDLDAIADISYRLPGSPVYTAIDIAVTESKGADWTVAVRGDAKGTLIDYDRFQMADYRVQVSRLAAYAGDTLCFIDETGVGHTITQMLQEAGVAVVPLSWTSPLKRQMIGSLAGALDRREFGLSKGVDWSWFLAELSHYEQKQTIKGEPTIKYGAAPGYHDDGVSAALMYAHQVWSPIETWTYSTLDEVITEYSDGRRVVEAVA